MQDKLTERQDGSLKSNSKLQHRKSVPKDTSNREIWVIW